MRIKKQLLILSVGLFSSLAQVMAMPAQVLLIRHGEKVSDQDPNLSARGFERAQALVGLFTSNAQYTEFGMPAGIFATEPNDPVWGSLRSIQTLTPLAKSLGLPVNHDYTKKKIKKLVEAIVQNSNFKGKTVVIAWEHNGIPNIAAELGAKRLPKKWDASVFDRVWSLRFEKGNFVQFQDLPQNLLPGDSQH